MTADNRKEANRHTWHFFRAGGFDQVRIESGADIAHLDQLDQKLWMALSCPTRGLEFDEKTLELLDVERDGRIRPPELIAAARWTCSLLKNPDELLKCSPSLPLENINDATPEGRQILASARRILASLGKPDAASISVDDTADTARIFAQTDFNGDGIIPAASAADPFVRSVIEDIIACMGADIDRSGQPGISQEKADRFFAEAHALLAWHARPRSEPAIMPLGQSTPSAWEALSAVRAKIDDYFARCRLAEFDPRAISALNRQENDYLAIAGGTLSADAAEVAPFPLAQIQPGKPLPLDRGLNPAWAAAIRRFDAEVVTPLLGQRQSLSEPQWQSLKTAFAPYEQFLAARPQTPVEKLGFERLQTIAASDAARAIAELIGRDRALEAEVSAVAQVDKLVRFNRDLYRLLNNFVNFRDFYRRNGKAVFQAGTLYMDQRACELCVRVEDMNRHNMLAHLSNAFLAYCECTRPATGEKMTIAAAFTAGDSDYLMVGRNGVFYDRQGRDWDATVVKIVGNPISIRQAFWSPYKRALRWIEEQLARRAALADAAQTQKLAAVAVPPTTPPAAGKPPEVPKPRFDVGVVAALGVAVGGITAALGALLQAFFGLGIWMPLGILAIILLISGPSMIIASLKLRQRNLGPLLDASGWAINGRARISIVFGGSLTSTATLPPGAKRDLLDPFADTRRFRKVLLATVLCAIVAAIALFMLWYFGVAERVFPGWLPRSPWYLRHFTGR